MAEILRVRREWHDLLSAERTNPQPRILYPAKLSLKIEGEIKSFLGKKKKKEEFIVIKPALQEMLEGILFKWKKLSLDMRKL